VTLQTHAPENFRLCRWGDERTAKRAQTVSEDLYRRGGIIKRFRTLEPMVSGQRLEWIKVRTGENTHCATNFNKKKIDASSI
jgi:hypothetical protein